MGGGVGYVLRARVRGITHGVVLCAIASNAIACTPAGVDQESIPYWIFTILWVVIWCAILAIVRRPTKRCGPSIANRENQSPGDVWWPTDDLPIGGSPQNRLARHRSRAGSAEFSGSPPYAPGKLPEPSIIGGPGQSSAARSLLRSASTVAGTARRPRRGNAHSGTVSARSRSRTDPHLVQ